MRIVFMGTPEFAIPSLEMMVSSGYDIVGVVTQPDKPKGRGNKLSMPPVKEFAVERGITVLQPNKVKTPEFAQSLRELKPDLFVTAAYGKILPKEVLDIPHLGCINVHGSLLPKYRGSAPVHWSIINGESVTGITTMFSDIGMDTGDMLLKAEIKITDDMTSGVLHDKLAVLGAEVLKDTLRKLEDGTLKRFPQNEEQATYAPMIKKEMGQIDWSKSSRQVHNLVRGTNPWPSASTNYKGDKMRIWVTEIIDEKDHNYKPGIICGVDTEGIVVACGVGMLHIKEVQFDSCRRMCVEDYICGHRIDEGEVLG